MTLKTAMVVKGSSSTTPSGSTASGNGNEATPYHIDMWDRITIPITTTVYDTTYSDPNSYNRCEVRTTLHFNNADRTQVDTSLPSYMFDSTTAPTKLGMQWKPSMLREDNILYGNDSNGKQIVFEDYLVVRI